MVQPSKARNTNAEMVVKPMTSGPVSPVHQPGQPVVTSIETLRLFFIHIHTHTRCLHAGQTPPPTTGLLPLDPWTCHTQAWVGSPGRHPTVSACPRQVAAQAGTPTFCLSATGLCRVRRHAGGCCRRLLPAAARGLFEVVPPLVVLLVRVPQQTRPTFLQEV